MTQTIVHLTTLHSRTDTRIVLKEARAIASAFPHEVIVVVADGLGDSAGEEGVAVRDLGRLRRTRLGRMLSGNRRALTAIWRINPDVVHFHDPELIPIGLLLRARGHKVIYDVHEDVPQQILVKHWVPLPIRHPLAWVTAGAEWIGAQVFSAVVPATPRIAVRFPAEKTTTVHNYVIPSELALSSPTPYSDRANTIAYVGVIADHRGMAEIVKAFAQQNLSSATLELAGPIVPAEYVRTLETMEGWSRIHYRGIVSREEVAGILGRSRAGLALHHPVPNKLDALPIKLFEYMSAGLPVITSDFPILRQIVGTAQCGLLVNPYNPTEIADAIRWILDHPEEAEAMGQRGREAAATHYNWESEAKKIVGLYHRILQTTETLAPSESWARAADTPAVDPALPASTPRRARFAPLVRNVPLRTLMGLAALGVSFATMPPGSTLRATTESLIVGIGAWALSVWVTHKYVHKYPQRYMHYLLASHSRAAAVLAVTMAALIAVLGSFGMVVGAPWRAVALFAVVDFLLSVPKRRLRDDLPEVGQLISDFKADGACPFTNLASVDGAAIQDELRQCGADAEVCALVEQQLHQSPGTERRVISLDDVSAGETAPSDRAALVLARPRMNDVRHLNGYLEHCASRVVEGGYVVLRYRPLENVLRDLGERYSGIRYRLAYALHFLWFRAVPKIPKLAFVYFRPMLSLDKLYVSIAGRRNRALARAEMWGRLAFWGFDVVAESAGTEDVVLIARAARTPIRNRVPSYLAVVGLEKVGLDGQPLRLHKVRTMFPFSEFLQKRVFEENGLAPSGKFANDFRLTEFGRKLRRYWIDEVPQLWDWLRGDIKLVGMRATSRHFLTLYPPEFINLYVQVKPGLVPPIFDSTIQTLDQIIAVEQRYLERYWRNPTLTDIKYFLQTAGDIALRGVRSK